MYLIVTCDQHGTLESWGLMEAQEKPDREKVFDFCASKNLCPVSVVRVYDLTHYSKDDWYHSFVELYRMTQVGGKLSDAIHGSFMFLIEVILKAAKSEFDFQEAP